MTPELSTLLEKHDLILCLCCKCDKFLDLKPGFGRTGVSHSYCEEHMEEERERYLIDSVVDLGNLPPWMLEKTPLILKEFSDAELEMGEDKGDEEREQMEKK